jgi:TPR repeat protein
LIRTLSFTAVTFAAVLLGSDLAAGKRAYEKGDYATALKELLPVADQGDPQALYLVGSMVFEGKGVRQDKRAGATLLQLAADAGWAEAELLVAMMYDKGDGVPKRTDNSLYWNRRAAEHGLPLAQWGMGVRSWTGEVGSKDHVQAYMWFSLCSASDNVFQGSLKIGEACAMSRNALAEEMTQGQIDEAKQRTTDWKAQHSVREDDSNPKRK